MKKSTLAIRILLGLAVVLVLGWFAYVNSGEYVDLHFGLFSLYDVSLPVLLYGGIILGMLLMIGVSLRSDLRTREAIRRYERIASDALSSFESAEADTGEEADRRAS